MTTLWLVRHGQTDWNIEGRYQGLSDVPLNVTGIDQAENAAQELSNHQFDAIFSSNLERAYHTAQIISEKIHLPIQVDPRLSEISLGEWEGVLFDEVMALHKDGIEERNRNPLYARPPGGECLAEVAERMQAALEDIFDAYPDGQVVIVSHGLALATLLCLSSGLPLEQAYQMIPDNACPIAIEWPETKQAERIILKDKVEALPTHRN